MKLNLRLARRGVRGLAAAVAATVLVAPAASAVEDPGALQMAPGVGTTTLWDPTTPLTDANGAAVPSLRSGTNGVSSVKFSSHGDAIVAEKRGRIIYFPREDATSGTVLAASDGTDLSADTLAAGDVGMGGIEFDPDWPRRPYVYAFYTSNDKLPAGTGKWTDADCLVYSACAAQSKIERLTIGQRRVDGQKRPYIKARKTLVEDWCSLVRTHAVGDLRFDRRGYLLASAGDGSVETTVPEVQSTTCATKVDPKYQGSAAAVDALDPSVAPSLNGKIIRIDPDTGEGAPGNPWGRSADENRRRIIAVGFRNPYRMAVSPDGRKLSVTMVGYTSRESLWTIPVGGRIRKVYNAGWPCNEAGLPLSIPPASNPICSDPARVPTKDMTPTVMWDRGLPLDPQSPCPSVSPSAAMGVTYTGRGRGLAPQYRRSLIFGDYGLGCVWSMKPGKAPAFMAMFDRHTVRAYDLTDRGEVAFADYRHGSVRKFTFEGSKPEGGRHAFGNN